MENVSARVRGTAFASTASIAAKPSAAHDARDAETLARPRQSLFVRLSDANASRHAARRAAKIPTRSARPPWGRRRRRRDLFRDHHRERLFRLAARASPPPPSRSRSGRGRRRRRRRRAWARLRRRARRRARMRLRRMTIRRVRGGSSLPRAREVGAASWAASRVAHASATAGLRTTASHSTSARTPTARRGRSRGGKDRRAAQESRHRVRVRERAAPDVRAPVRAGGGFLVIGANETSERRPASAAA